SGADLRSRKVREHGDWRADVDGCGSHREEAMDVLVERAMAQVEPHDVDAGLEHLHEHVVRFARRPDRGDDLGPPVHSLRSLIGRQPSDLLTWATMELLLIRHALPVRRELVEGPADPELSEAGLAQAERLADYLADETLHAIYVSPLRRAV